PEPGPRLKKTSGMSAGDQVERRAVGKKESSLSGPIELNQATVAELQRLPGIGPKLSQRIVDERQKGFFKSVDDLRRVPGIGPKTLERLRPYVTVETVRGRVVAANETEPVDRGR